MAQQPFLVHLVDVLMHLTTAVLLYAGLMTFTGRRAFALVAALVFVTSPLAAPSVVWPAALMDRLYILWGLGALLVTERYLRGASWWWLLPAIFLMALAILSKETAMMLPAALLLRAAWQPRWFREWRLWIALAAWTLPVVLYLLVRLPALLATLHNTVPSPYGIQPALIPQGLALYLSFPFLPSVAEAVNWIKLPNTRVAFALALHAALVLALWWRCGWRAALTYVAAYLLFLLPVVAIPNRGAHYLYGSALAFSAGIAALLQPVAGRFGRVGQGLAAAALSVALLHAIIIQGFSLVLGRCMDRAAETAEAAYVAAGRPPVLRLTAEPGAPRYILFRLFTGRDQIGAQYPIRLLIEPEPAAGPPGAVDFTLDASCSVGPAGRARE